MSSGHSSALDHGLVTSYVKALLEGNPDYATALGQQLLSTNSDEATFALLAKEAHRHQIHGLAILWAEQGLAQHASSSMLKRQLGIALASAGRFESAEPMIRQALLVEQEDLEGQLALGQALAHLDRTTESLKAYCKSLALAGRLSSDQWEQLPSGTQADLHAAQSCVSNARADAAAEALKEVRQQYGAGSFRRIHQAVQNYLAGQVVTPPHPLQRPTFLFVPGLPDRPWFERAEFPFLASLESETEAIRQEMLGVLSDPDGLKPYVEMAEDAPAAPIWRELNHSTLWSAFHLYRHGQRVEEHCRRCPRTVAALERLPLHSIPEHGPEIMFSVLQPYTRIPPHTGVVNGRLTVHLPLIVPENCGALRAGGEARPWREGECLIFDDSFVHEAWNDSDQVRVVLIFDLWNPNLNDAERDAMSAAIAAIGRFNSLHGGEDPMQEKS